MAQATLRRKIKKEIDRLPDDRLESISDYIAFLNQKWLRERIEKAERDLKAGKGIDWRKVRNDV